tara:strand:+ start:8110 stop:8418 length:309 start_codon:yes stop_codon:yes gene_type:complete
MLLSKLRVRKLEQVGESWIRVLVEKRNSVFCFWKPSVQVFHVYSTRGLDCFWSDTTFYEDGTRYEDIFQLWEAVNRYVEVRTAELRAKEFSELMERKAREER